MDVITALEERRSKRGYKPDPVDPSVIGKILEAAGHTPSWANSQPWEVFVATGEVLERIRAQYLENFRKGVPVQHEVPRPKEWPEAHQKRMGELQAAHFAIIESTTGNKEEIKKKFTENNLRFFGAPVVFFLCLDKGLSPWSLFDLGAFSQSIMLAAQHYGLNTVPAVMFASYPDVIRRELHVPPEFNIAMGIALGYADPENIENTLRTSRRPLEDFARL